MEARDNAVGSASGSVKAKGWKKRRVLVTGGSGFIGSHLTGRLLQEGAEVHLWVRPSTDLWRLTEIREKVSLHSVDLSDESAVKRSCHKIQPEIVYHLAAHGVDYREQDVVQALEVNVRGTVNLIRAIEGGAGTRLIHTGTWAEYGPKSRPMSETDSLEPVGLYGCTKAASTAVAYGVAGQRGVPLIVLRPFSVYGPGEGRHKFIPYVILSLLKGETPRLSSCRQIRDYVYVDDVAEAYLKAADAPVDRHLTINVASGTSVSLKDLVGLILKIYSRGDVLFGAVPHRKDEIWQVVADVSLAKEILGWQAKTPLEEGLRKTVDWFKRQQGAKRPS